MTDQIMFDAVTVGNIPRSPKPWAVAGYTSGLFHTWPTIEADFPNSHLLAINIAGLLNGDGLDCEPGDVPVTAFDEIAAWIKRNLPRKDKNVILPVVYCSLSNAQMIVNALAVRGLRYGIDYLMWTAHYTFRQHRCSPVCGFGWRQVAHLTQFTDRANGVSLDASACDPGIFGTPIPTPVPPTPVDPYRIFVDHDLACRDVRTGLQVILNEKQTVIAFDKAIISPEHAPGQTVALWFQVAALRNRVWHQAHTFPDGRGHLPSWGIFHRGTRFQELDHRSHGIN